MLHIQNSAVKQITNTRSTICSIVNTFNVIKQQRVAMTKATKTDLDIDRNRRLGEAAPAAISDVEAAPKVEE